jgi:hypothetical protein
MQDLDLYGVETWPARLGDLLSSRARLAPLGRGSEKGCVARVRAGAGRRLALYGIRREDFTEVIRNNSPKKPRSVYRTDICPRQMSTFSNRMNTPETPTLSMSQGLLGFGEISVGAHESITIITGVANVGLGRDGQTEFVLDHENETNGCIDLSADGRPEGASLTPTLLDP